MKSILTVALISTILFFTNCKKSDSTTNARPSLIALQQTWTLKSTRCYENPIGILNPSVTYYSFKTDMNLSIYGNGGIAFPFSYNLLEDDSTLIWQSSSIPDTFVITKLTSTELVFHGKNTYAHNTSACINGNILDSLYR